jgi:hypothetical protein
LNSLEQHHKKYSLRALVNRFVRFQLATLFFPALFFGQVSYEFTIPLPPNGNQTERISPTYFGIYSSQQSDVDYEFSEKGVFVVSMIYCTISRETIRESSKYRVNNGWLIGVKENDSVPCELQGEYYHFAVKNREQIIGNDESLNTLCKISDITYILNFEENGYYSPSIFEFKGSELHIRHFNYEEETTIFEVINDQVKIQEEGMTIIALRPTKEEWQKIPIEGMIGARTIYNRN